MAMWHLISRRAISRVLLAAAFLLMIVTVVHNASGGFSFGSIALGGGDPARTSFRWDNPPTDEKQPCRNTKQGARIMTDERGYTCRWENSTEYGCCAPSNSTYRYECRGCIVPSLCCSTFEFCVSCCLRPEERSFLRDLVAQAASLVVRDAQDPFELCLARCRTSSASVVHENSYRDPEYKYCVKS